jgi:hypothetical protein
MFSALNFTAHPNKSLKVQEYFALLPANLLSTKIIPLQAMHTFQISVTIHNFWGLAKELCQTHVKNICHIIFTDCRKLKTSRLELIPVSSTVETGRYTELSDHINFQFCK